METHKDIPIKSFKEFARHEPVVLDSTAIMEYKRCPRRYFYRMVLGFTTNDKEVYFAWGSAYHKYRELLDVTYLKFKGQEPNKGKLYEVCDLVAKNAALKIWERDYPKDPTIGTKYDFLTKLRLMQSFEAAFEWWKKEREAGIIEIISTEQFFTVVLPDGSIIGGRSDRVISKNGFRLWGQDYKTTTKNLAWYSRTLTPNNQFALYTYAESKLHGKRVRGQIVEVLFNDKRNGPKIEPYPVEFTDSQLIDWEKDVMKWIKKIRESREEDHYEMSETGCSYCPYHMVCKSMNENGMKTVLQNRYTVKPWDCSKTEDEEG